jgi:hypothetical protein
MTTTDARFHLAWLIWCYTEGYVKPEDRGGHNWLLDDPTTMHTDDLRLRTHLLVMADEVLTLL